MFDRNFKYIHSFSISAYVQPEFFPANSSGIILPLKRQRHTSIVSIPLNEKNMVVEITPTAAETIRETNGVAAAQALPISPLSRAR